nr:hypothetical protein Itr_chr12CG24590 [Ipomoea trifida]
MPGPAMHAHDATYPATLDILPAHCTALPPRMANHDPRPRRLHDVHPRPPKASDIAPFAIDDPRRLWANPCVPCSVKPPQGLPGLATHPLLLSHPGPCILAK